MLVASLHQGISDLIPTRLEFYENWLNPVGMRNGKIGLAPLAAVLSFLRQEGEPYTLVTSRAGEYAAQWTFDNLTSIERSFIRALPVMMRARMAMQLARKVVRRSYGGSRAAAKLRRGQGTLTLRSSIFCTVREPFDWPLCVSIRRRFTLFALVGVSGEVRVHTARDRRRGRIIAVNVPPEQSKTCGSSSGSLFFGSSFHVLRSHSRLQGTSERVLVIPFENPAREARVYWVSEASAVLLADELNALGRHAHTREERLDAFQRLQVPPVATLSHATVIRLGQVVGATHVVIGSFRLTGGMLSVRARSIRLDTGQLEHEFVEAGPLEDLFATFERIGRRLAGPAATGVSPARPALPVFENYIKGLVATATPAKVGYLAAAIKLDPGFDRARLALWSVHHDEGNGQVALVTAAAIPESSPMYARARFSAALSLLQLKRLDDAFATFRTLADRTPTATLMNNLGVIQLRRPVTPQTGRATYYFNQALKLAEDDPDYYSTWAMRIGRRRTPSAIFWLRERTPNLRWRSARSLVLR